MKYLTFLLFFMPILILGQENIEKQLDSIASIDDAKQFIDANKKAKGKIFTFNREKHQTRLADDLFNLAKGGKKVIKSEYKTTFYKIIEKNKIMHERVNYIFFDSSKMELSEINALRTQIISKYKAGYNFKTLAQYYSMDTNAKKGGDSGWFSHEAMPSKFQNAVKSRNVDDIFTLDIPEINGYYVILKAHESKSIEEITVLKFSEPGK